jgi:hypothetical protein
MNVRFGSVANVKHWRPLLPLDCARRLGGDVVDHAVDAAHLIDDAPRGVNREASVMSKSRAQSLPRFERIRALLNSLIRDEGMARRKRASAGSQQGLIVVPGGAPMPPECSCCVHQPAGAAPRPAIKTPLERPSKDEVIAVYARFGTRGLFGERLNHRLVIPAKAGSRTTG